MNIYDETHVAFLLPLHLLSPGVIITDVHKRAGLDEEQYAQVPHHVNTVLTCPPGGSVLFII